MLPALLHGLLRKAVSWLSSSWLEICFSNYSWEILTHGWLTLFLVSTDTSSFVYFRKKLVPNDFTNPNVTEPALFNCLKVSHGENAVFRKKRVKKTRIYFSSATSLRVHEAHFLRKNALFEGKTRCAFEKSDLFLLCNFSINVAVFYCWKYTSSIV